METVLAGRNSSQQHSAGCFFARESSVRWKASLELHQNPPSTSQRQHRHPKFQVTPHWHKSQRNAPTFWEKRPHKINPQSQDRQSIDSFVLPPAVLPSARPTSTERPRLCCHCCCRLASTVSKLVPQVLLPFPAPPPNRSARQRLPLVSKAWPLDSVNLGQPTLQLCWMLWKHSCRTYS